MIDLLDLSPLSVAYVLVVLLLDNEYVKQLIYVLDDYIWGMKITVLEEFVNFAILDTKKLFSNLKSYELSRKNRPNHDASFSNKALNC
jgi:hypothetical protein